MITKICKKCEKEFLILKWRLKESNRGQFCTKSCAISFRCFKGGRDILKVRAAKRRWAHKNQEYTDFKRRQWYYQKRNAIGNHTLQQWLNVKAFSEFSCVKCLKKEPEIKLTEDHIVPLSMGGSNYIKNIQPLCLKCNSSKGAKTYFYLPIILSGNYIGGGS